MRMKFLFASIGLIVLAALLGCGAPTALDEPTLQVAGAQLGNAPAQNLAASHIASGENGAASLHAQGSADLSLDKIIVTQAVEGEPLIWNKETIVRAVIGSSDAGPHEARVTVEFDGKTFTETKPVQGKQTVVNVFVGAPQNFQTQTIKVRVEAVNGASDANVSNNAQSVTVPMVKPSEKIIAYFLPVDWTAEQRNRYNFDASFPKFIKENEIYLRGVFPLPQDQVQIDYSNVPHMLAANEKRLANNQGDNDAISSHLMYATISLAARRLKPDATMVIGVLPPGWFAAHGSRSTLGMALADVKGTVTAQFALTDATTSAHELAHLFWMYEDYDYSISPSRPFTWLDRSGYFVEKRVPQEISDSKKIPTFLSAYSPDAPGWVDTRIYEYLTAKFTIEGNGQVTEPLILAATMARLLEGDDKNYPSDYAAGWQRYEPKNTVYVGVGAAGMRGNENIEARWFMGDQQIFKENKTAKPGNAWYGFSLRNKNGMPQGNYRVEIYLDGNLAKTSKFEVKGSQ